MTYKKLIEDTQHKMHQRVTSSGFIEDLESIESYGEIKNKIKFDNNFSVLIVSILEY